VTRRAIADVVREATLGSSGVTGLVGGPIERALGWLGIGQPGIRPSMRSGLAIELELRVAHGLPVAEVARQVDHNVRFAVRRALERDIARLVLHVDGLEVRPAAQPPVRTGGATGRRDDGGGVRPGDLADSGTDVA
jgi:uncharacterized alkaline shock family protein YloU